MARPKQITYQEALSKLERYCAYQERCHHDVRYKLVALGIRGEELEEIISQLVQQKYLDETRYAKTFARGKLRMNAWGWQKIRLALKKKGISDYNLEQARMQLSDEGYREILCNVLMKKNKQLRRLPASDRKRKIFQHAYTKGFETDLISEVLTEIQLGD